MKRGKYRLLAILLAMLMITLPFSFALDFDLEQQAKEANVGEAIIVNVQGYEPTSIPSSLIEDGDVPIYAFLTGITTAKLLGSNANYEPFYGQALIKQVRVRPLDEATKNYVRGSPQHVQPTQYSMENLGYLIITLKQIEKEADVPVSDKNFGLLGGSDITLKMNAEITFESVERLFGLVHQDLIIEQFTNEDEWKSKALDASSFFSNRGFVRAREINVDNVKLTVYGGSDMVWPYTGAPRPIGDLSLKVGEISDYYRLSEMSGLATNAFRVKLVELVNPNEKRAKIKVIINNQEQERIVKVGSKVYPGSRLTISSISSSGTDNNIKQSVSIQDYTTATNAVLTKTSKAQANTDVVVKDICEENVILLDESETVDSWKQKIESSTDVAVYCTAAAKYKEIVKNYFGVVDGKGILYEDLANFRLGQIYEFLNDKQRALNYYKEAVKNKNGEFMAEAMHKIDTLGKEKAFDANFLDFLENNQNIRVQLIEVLGQDSSNAPTINVQVSGENTKPLTVGKNLFLKELEETIEGITYKYNWELTVINNDYITIEKKYSANKPKDYRGMTQQVYLRQKKVIDQKDIYVSEINLKKYAMISILPGSGEPLISNSNFTVHIPIEKRAIDFTPAQIEKQLNKTQEIIKELDDIIEKLDKVVVTWRKVCMVTFAYLTIKNTFFSGLARTQARRFALNGVDGKSGWNQFCRENSGVGKTYGRYDDCILENTDAISTTINAAQESIEQVNDDMENYKEKDWYKNLNKNFTSLDKYGKYMGEDLQDAQSLRDYRYWQLMQNSDAYSQFDKYNFKKEIDTNLNTFNLTQTTKLNAYQKTLEQLNKYQGFDNFEEDKKLQVFSDLYSANKLNVKIESSSFTMVDKLNLGTLSTIRIDNNKPYAYTSDGEKQLQAATVKDYRDYLQQQWTQEKDETKKKALEEEITRINNNYQKTGFNAPLTTNQGQVYKEGNNKFYVSESKAYSIGDLNKNYANGASAEVYPDGKPYCVPTGNGNFVKVLDFHKDGSPSVIQEWNVGSDGLLCTNDDLLIKHESVLARPEYQSENNNLINQISRMGIHKQGESINVGGKNFLVSNSRAQADYSKEQPNCFDTMDPGDCQLLFGVCDPVMCPPSRFNLGGTWQVNDVVQTGLIGSIVLGLPNFDIPYEPVPVCLTGILAGLQNVKSVLRGYVECLNTAQVQGKSVGICDKIRSVFICELLWKEGIAILNLKGSLLTWVSQTLFGQERGGAEYATFDSSLQNIADSVSFFTKGYATTAFAAYQSRSFSEVGTTICKQAIFGKFPGLGSFLNEIAQPESPPQYTALLTESPFSEKLQQSRYQTFYHIYAGEDKEATISVWLEDSTRRLPIYYVTNRCEGIRADIPKGGISSQNIDCVAAKGYDRVCISINGMTECGFGKVSSDFAIDYLNDLIVEDELGKKITSEEECYPSASSSSYSLTDEIGLLSTGVVRVCSLQNPGSGTDTKKWKVIGECGKDSTGRSLGSCWLDTTTVSIKDTERMANVMDALNEQGFEQQKLALGITGLLNEEQSSEQLKIIDQMAKDSYETKITASLAYSVLSKSTTIPKIAAETAYKAVELLVSKEVLAKAHKDPDRIMVGIKAEFGKTLEKIFVEYTNKAKEIRAKYTGDSLKDQMNTLEGQYQEAIDQAYKMITEYINAEFKGTAINVENLIEKEIETKLYEEYYNKDLEQATIVAGTQNVIASNCNKCGEGAFNGCNKDECHALGNCYAQKTISGLGIYYSCNLCTGAKSCSDFNNDEIMCNNQQCTSSFGSCEYKNGNCVAKAVQFTQPTEAQCSNIVQTAARYIGTGYGGTDLCSPEVAIGGACTTQCGSFVSSVFYYAGQEKRQPTGNGNDICNPTNFPIEDTVSHNKFTDRALLQPGDIFEATSSSRPQEGHAGIFVGKGKIQNPVSGTSGCYSKFIPDATGEEIFIHSTGPVCYSTFDFLFKEQGRRLITFCRQKSCCLPNDPVCGKS